MLDRILTETQLRDRITELSRSRRIIGPRRRAGRFFYEVVTDADEIALDFNYCVFSPKSFLFPPREVLFAYERHKGAFAAKPLLDEGPTALVGVHPCDLHAIALLDSVFSQAPPDPHYLGRRRNALLIGIDCAVPCTQGVFCGDMQTNSIERGFDLMCYPLGGPGAGTEPRFGVRAGTEFGRRLILSDGVGVASTDEDEQAFTQSQRRKESAFPDLLPVKREQLRRLVAKSYDSLLWEAIARRCYSCGSCNLVCPTCYCFDVQDESDLTGQCGHRRREWDACQLSNFAVVAGGHNFRPKASARLRHRLFRKAAWIEERTGLAGCVGCSRCSRACTARINIAETYSQLCAGGSM